VEMEGGLEACVGDEVPLEVLLCSNLPQALEVDALSLTLTLLQERPRSPVRHCALSALLFSV
jgi:hypothetical protein